MQEIIKFVLDHFGISKDDLRPSSHPEPTNNKARVILATFLKEKNFTNSQIKEVLFTNDDSVIYYLMRRLKVYPELNSLHSLLTENFKDVQGDGYTLKAKKRCVKCKEKKFNYLNFRKLRKGRYYHLCFNCEEENNLNALKPKPVPVKNEKCTVLKAKVLKPKVVPKKIKVDTKPPISLIDKKSGYGAKKINFKDADHALKVAKEREHQLLNNGAKYVKNGIRAFVLTK